MKDEDYNQKWCDVDILKEPPENLSDFYKCTEFCLSGEVWVDYHEMPNRYEVSSFGRVRSKSKRIHGRNVNGDFSYMSKPKIIKVLLTKENYIQARLRGDDRKDYTRKVHRMVLISFKGLSEVVDRNQVNHKNSVRFDNRLNNLEWLTQKENINHGFSEGGRCLKGENHPSRILNEDIVRDILKRSLNGQKAKQICDELGYKYHTIQKVIVRKNWSHVEI